MNTQKQSVFMQMHNGTRTGEGSFNHGLQKLFYLADISNKRKLVAAFPEFFGEEVPTFGIYADDAKFKFPDKHTLKHGVVSTRTGLSDKKMNIRLHLKGVSRQNLEESLKDSGEMINCLSPLINEMLQKHQDNIQQDNNIQVKPFRLLLQFQKYDIEFSVSEFHEALNDTDSVYDRL